jgi:hypothetical protein
MAGYPAVPPSIEHGKGMSEEFRFSLTNDKRLVTDKELAYNEFGTGTFAFRVKGEQTLELRGKPVRLFFSRSCQPSCNRATPA